MDIPTDAILLTVALIVGFIYFRAQKKTENSIEIQSGEEE